MVMCDKKRTSVLFFCFKYLIYSNKKFDEKF